MYLHITCYKVNFINDVIYKEKSYVLRLINFIYIYHSMWLAFPTFSFIYIDKNISLMFIRFREIAEVGISACIDGRSASSVGEPTRSLFWKADMFRDRYAAFWFWGRQPRDRRLRSYRWAPLFLCLRTPCHRIFPG